MVVDSNARRPEIVMPCCKEIVTFTSSPLSGDVSLPPQRRRGTDAWKRGAAAWSGRAGARHDD